MHSFILGDRVIGSYRLLEGRHGARISDRQNGREANLSDDADKRGPRQKIPDGIGSLAIRTRSHAQVRARSSQISRQ